METLPPPPITFLTARLTYRADEPLVLPRWKGALLRGGLGRALRHALCLSTCPNPQACPRPDPCPYRVLFAPDGEEAQTDLQGVRDAPRPYAVLPPLAAQTHYAPGEPLTFELLLAGRAQRYLPQILLAFETLGVLGLGAARGRATLTTVEQRQPLTGQIRPLRTAAGFVSPLPVTSGAQLVAVAAALPSTLTLHFMTPLRLKYAGALVQSAPPCHVLVRGALRRISQLCAYFGDEPWEIPFGAVIDQAGAVALRGGQTQWVDWSRTSGATGQQMTLGGLVGRVTYTDIPPPVRAVLLLGMVTHIGKAVVFGHGAYRITIAEDSPPDP